MRETNALESKLAQTVGGKCYFLCRNLNWSSLPVVLCIVCGGVNNWIDFIQLLVGPPVEPCLRGI